MATLKKFFPLSFKYTADVASLIVGILIYIVLGIIAGALVALATFLTGWIPVLGPVIAWLLGIVSSLFGVYNLAGIVILILAFAKVIKD